LYLLFKKIDKKNLALSLVHHDEPKHVVRNQGGIAHVNRLNTNLFFFRIEHLINQRVFSDPLVHNFLSKNITASIKNVNK